MENLSIEKAPLELFDSGEPLPVDLDQDGVSVAEGDCNDEDPNVSPLLEEEPYDGIDNDCNQETVDDDLDQDGYSLEEDCDDENPDLNVDCPTDSDEDGVSIESGDCNDNDPNVYPGHPDDNCDNIDNNCNRETDENWIGDHLENNGTIELQDDDDIYLVGYTYPNEDLDQFILETTTVRTLDIEPGHELDIHIYAFINNNTWISVIEISTDELFSFELYPYEYNTNQFKIELYSQNGDCSNPYELQIGYP